MWAHAEWRIVGRRTGHERHVWEWTSSLHKAYPYDAKDGRESNSDTSNARILRGGSWALNFGVAADLRTTFRNQGLPVVRTVDGGFRCARSY
jgi:formylglycine-generating enzyme required for sulfatase activity